MPVNQMDGIYTDYPRTGAAAELHHGEGLRRLDRAPARACPTAFEQVTANMSHRHGGPPRAAEVSCWKRRWTQVKQLANQKPEDSPLALPLKKFPASISGRRAGAHQDRDAGRDRKGSAAGLPALCALPGGELHSRRPRRARHRRPARRRKVLPVSDHAHHHDRPDRRTRFTRSAWTR